MFDFNVKMASEWSTRADQIIDNFRERSRDIQGAVQNIKRAQQSLRDRRASPTFQVVPGKVVYQGARGGMYYLNAANRRTYLTPGQCERCKQGSLKFVSKGCPPAHPDKKACQIARPKLKKKLRNKRKQQ